MLLVVCTAAAGAGKADGQAVSGPASAPASRPAAAPAPPLAAWGRQVLDQIDKDLRVPGTGLYAEWLKADGRRGNDFGKLSFVWPAGFQFRALAAAARVQPDTYGKPLTDFAKALDAYWAVRDGLDGYMVLTSRSERFYDDNAWIALGMIETHQITRREEYLKRAIEALAFVASGEAKTPGGGIRQHEDKPGPSSICTTAPTAVAALRLYRITHDRKYLADGERWYAWLTSPEVGVQDPADGLFDDQAAFVDGKWTVRRGKRAYNSALPLQAAVLLFQIREDPKYLRQAQRIAAAALTRWVRPSGAMKETGQWGGGDLVDALCDLYDADHDPRWLAAVRSILRYVHDHGRDPNGRYGEYWNVDRRTMPLEECKLLYMAPVARAFWRAARYP